MSLLMDALRKAEEAKRRGGAEAPGSSAVPAPAPGAGEGKAAEAPADAPDPAPEERLALADDGWTAPQRPALPTEEAQQREQAAAYNVFAAKQAPAGARRPFHLVLAALTALAAMAIGGWFWYQMQPRSALAPPPAPSARPPALTSAATPAAATAAAPAVAPAAATAAAPAPPAAPARAASAAVAAAPAAALSARGEDARPAPRAAVPAPAPPRAERSAEPAPAKRPPLSITRSRPQVHPSVLLAHERYGAGDLAGARSAFDAALRAEPHNRDALHGLAALGLREGRPEEAAAYYQRALESDPKDSVAQAALVGLQGQADPMHSESRLKGLIAAQPEAPSAHFALGNLYAGQGRWGEAQQAYFRAYTAEPENPDYQFNLAVSLDQLRQGRLALQFYQGALAAAATRPPAFDPAQVARRVRELQQ